MIRSNSPNFDVSRETLMDLELYCDLVEKWNSPINLVSKSSLQDIWNRHIWDSAQLVDYLPYRGKWVDLGSGGGFPGLVIAIFVKHLSRECSIVLIESDQRKSAFLRTVARELSLEVSVLTNRIELLKPQNADVLSARALTDLTGLLAFADRHLSKDGTALFLKGETWKHEVEIARESWSFDLRTQNSKTNPKAAILEVKEIERV